MYQGQIKATGRGNDRVFIIMVSLTFSLLLEVWRSWEKRGEKTETECSKTVSHFKNCISDGTQHE